MRTVPVKFTKGTRFASVYSSTIPTYAFVSKFENGSVRMLSHFEGCREYLCRTLLKKVRNSYTKGSWLYDIDTKRTRIAIKVQGGPGHRRKDHDRKIRTAVKVLNLIERRVKWPLSKAYNLKNDVAMSGTTCIAMFVGSGKWIRAQQLLSLYCLLIRTAYHHNIFKDVKNFKDLEKLATSMSIESERYRVNNARYNDLCWFSRLSKYIIILEKFNTIFKDLPMSKNYSTSAIGSIGQCFGDGISTLLDGRSRHKALTEKIHKSLVKADKKSTHEK